MTDLRTAAQQALEALKSVALHRPNDETNNAIIALRAALAEPVQEPVARLSTDCISERYLGFSGPLYNDPVQPLYAAPLSASCWSITPPHPEGEK